MKKPTQKTAASEAEAKSEVAIRAPAILRTTIKLRGISTLIMHAWSRKAIEMIEAKQQKKAVGPKTAKVPLDEFNGARYIIDEATDGMPHPSPRISPQYLRLLSINKLIAAESDVDYVLKTVLYYALELAEAEAGAILLVDAEGAIAAASARNMEGCEDELALSMTLSRAVIEGGNDQFTGRAARISYDRSKDLLILEGDGRTDAELYPLYRKLYFAFGERQSKPIGMGDVLPELRRIAARARGGQSA